MPSQNTIKGIEAFACRIKGIDVQALSEGLEIARLHRQVEQAMEHFLAGGELTARQIEIMESLYHHPEGTMTPAALSDEVHLTRSSMTGALDSLERLGHTQRQPHPGDRRKLAISLTPQGRAFLKRILPDRYRKLHRIMACLTLDERTALLQSYRKVLDFLCSDMDQER